MNTGALVAVLVGSVFLLSGCQYLLGLSGALPPGSIGGSFDPGAFASLDPGALDPSDSFDPGADPGESVPPPAATYRTGSASITIGDTVTTLDKMTEPGVLYDDFGAEASWTDGAGNYVQFYSDPNGSSPGDGFVQLDRISGGQHLATGDPSSCVVKVTAADTKGLSGSATCKGLSWVDTMGGLNGISQSPPPVGDPFDATITFEAAP